MSLAYRLMYRLGITPWEHREPPLPLADLMEGPGALPHGSMADIGCGTGYDAIYCARQGWQATGIDAVPRALAKARANATAAGVELNLVQADITRPGDTGLGGGYTLLLDLGCFHGLTDAQRDVAAANMDRMAAPGAKLLLFAFKTAGRGPMPRGADADELRRRFSGWELTWSRLAPEVALKGPFRTAEPSWYLFTRR